MQNIVILRLSALGDCINAYGLIYSLYYQYCILQQNTNLNLYFVVDQRFASLFPQDIEQIKIVEVDSKQGLLKAISSLKHKLKHLRLLSTTTSNPNTSYTTANNSNNNNDFDVLLNMQTSIKASLLSLAISSPIKVGYDVARSREGHSFFINKRIEVAPNPHVISGFLEFANAIEMPLANIKWDFQLKTAELKRASELLKLPYASFSQDTVLTKASTNKICAISPCSAKSSKNWTIDGYIKIANYAIQQGFTIVLLGGNSALEESSSQQIQEELEPSKVINLCGKTNLRELAAILKLSSILIAPDSGSMHLASALNTPVIGLFAIHNPLRVGPWNYMDLNVSVYENLALHELGIKQEQSSDLSITSQSIPWRYRIKQQDAMHKITFEMVKNKFDYALKHYLI